MATLDTLKKALKEAEERSTGGPVREPLSDEQYSGGLDILKQGSGWLTYEDFIIPQMTRLLDPLFESRSGVRVLEIGPGPVSLVTYLPRHLRSEIIKYKAFEPNRLCAARLEDSLNLQPEGESILPSLKSAPEILRQPFAADEETRTVTGTSANGSNIDEKYDLIIFCHSMYGMRPKHVFIEQAIDMLTGSLGDPGSEGMVVIFHRDNRDLHFENLACYQTSSFPTGIICVRDNDEELDLFASFVAGFSVQGRTDGGNAVLAEWRHLCRALGRREDAKPRRLLFSSPELMMSFRLHSSGIQYLEEEVGPLVEGHRTVKNREAILHHPVSVVKVETIHEVEYSFEWAQWRDLSLTVIGGGHSGHCLWPNVVAVDMQAFNQVHIVIEGQDKERSTLGPLVVAEAGCNIGDVIRKSMEKGLTVPLGARPSVGAGMWLQGGIGHLTRLHGLACDAIVGAVIVCPKIVSPGRIDGFKARVLYVGNVPSQLRPREAVRPENEADLLWAIKGAGTNFGIVVRVTFQAQAAPIYRTRNWVVNLDDIFDAQQKISDFDTLVAKKLPRNFSADAYLYREGGKMHLAVTMFEAVTEGTVSRIETFSSVLDSAWGPGDNLKTMDGLELFDAEMYMCGMHGGHGGGKTSSFKRCVFLKHIGEADIARRLVELIQRAPSTFCYIHLLQGGGAVGDVSPKSTAFGCRDWDFACVITGVWTDDRDGTEDAHRATQWVYDVAEHLLTVSSCRGAYGADLGPDPRDLALARVAFGPNRLDLALLKRHMDPRNVLAYSCPLPKISLGQKVIILVTGESCAGKDFCADVWVSVLTRSRITHHDQITARTVSISSKTKREYAEATDADLGRLLWDRAYKEQHRPALTAHFKNQARERPNLPEEQFLSVARDAADIDVLLITGMRDEAPLAAFSHLVPESRLIEVYIQTSEEQRRCRGGRGSGNGSDSGSKDNSIHADHPAVSYSPTLIFKNSMRGSRAAEKFAKRNLLPFMHEDLQKLASMVSIVPDFPRPGIGFRHVLGITQKSGGLGLCISLLQSHFTGDWSQVDSVACCESGGFVFASALSLKVDVPLLLIREAGKLPPPTISVTKKGSYVSTVSSGDAAEARIELELDKFPKPKGREARIAVIDDVLSTGETLCAVLRLLVQAGARAENVSVMVVAEFPVHRGRELLRQHGFGRTNVRSLLIFDGA